MHIKIITPAAPNSRAGNRATAERWKTLLQQGGHRVEVITEYRGELCDVFVALHAWRSASAVRRFRETWPDKTLIVALTGTDLYHHQFEYPETTRYSMAAADILIGLHDRVVDVLPADLAHKLITLYQSAEGPECIPPATVAADKTFKVCVIGHLRAEKDPLRAAAAARLLPPESRIQVVCAGKAHDQSWEQEAVREAAENERFQWLGEVDTSDIRELMAGSQLMVISSIMEGGANVVSEACRAGLPVIASDIPGNLGLLAKSYEGYFPVGDGRALADLLLRAERDPEFLARLESQVARLADRFMPEKEHAVLEQALNLAMQRCAQRITKSG